VEDVYAAADVFVSPSRAEGMPFAVAEALACGTPVVASDIPGHRYICGDHTGCELVPLDAGALAAALSRGSGGDMAEARGWLERNMDIQVWAERLFDRYEAAGVIQRSSAVPS
jgi:glycosyltransferase involved in cell wall biosynthesis